MVAIKAHIILSVILLATFVIVTEGDVIVFGLIKTTKAEEKCLDEFVSELEKPMLKTLCFGPEDTGTRIGDAVEYGDECETNLWFGRCLNIFFQNHSEVCNAEIQKSIWKKSELLWNKAEPKYDADIQLSLPQCLCFQEFLQTKIGKQATENTIVQCSKYKAFENCTNEVRRKCVPKVQNAGGQDGVSMIMWRCKEAFALYKCYDEQFQNATHCSNDIKKAFWEHEKYQIKRILSVMKTSRSVSEGNTECECVVELFDEKIKNAIPSQNPDSNSAYAIGIQSPIIGTMMLVSVFLKNFFVLMEYLN